MSLDLDKRQRAMLREMGVRVWQPRASTPEFGAEVASPPAAVAGKPIPASSVASASLPVQLPDPPNATAPVRASPPRSVIPLESHAATAAGWVIGTAHALYAQQTAAAPAPAPGSARWLILTESAAPEGTHPFDGDAGKLLDNMLRAAQRHVCGQPTFCAPLTRGNTSSAEAAPLLPALAALIEETQPAVILIMGRHAAQAVLGSAEPLGKLRGQFHDLLGTRAVVTYEPGYLLRSLPDKAKAWADLCRALAPQASE
jgi:uracil-DNA glycosylase